MLRHDGRQTSRTIALLRARNDVVLACPDVAPAEVAAAQRERPAERGGLGRRLELVWSERAD